MSPQSQGNTLPTKLCAPRLTTVSLRPRLFKALDAALARPVIWIQGAAGAGKTTLVASWLATRKQRAVWYQIDEGDTDPASFFYYLGKASHAAAPRFRTPLPLLALEQLPSLQVFARRYFEEFFRRLKAPAVVVFDDYQNVLLESGFHEVFAQALEIIPQGVTVVILSRSEPPVAMARLCANNAVARLNSNDLHMTVDETSELAKTQTGQALSADYVQALHTRTEGWAAGIILLTAWSSGANPNLGELDRQVSGTVFDYFASQIFSKADERTQSFLIVAAHLSRMTARMAQALTGVEESAQILEKLARLHFFTQRQTANEPTYQFHALFREFLLAHAKTELTEEERRAIWRKAAELLHAVGEVEQAVSMLIEAADWGALGQMILPAAPMLIVTGRAQTLENWITAFPPGIRDKQPWLVFWTGICRLVINPPEGARMFAVAFGLFEEQQDALGMFLCWSRRVEANLISLDECASLDELIDWYYARGQHLPFPSIDIEAEFSSLMVSAMGIRQIMHPDASLWAARAQAALRNTKDQGIAVRAYFHLIYFYLARDADMAWQLVGEMSALAATQPLPPLMRLHTFGMKAIISVWAHGYTAEGAEALDKALEESHTHGIHFQDNMLFGLGVWISVMRNDRAGAQDFLKKASRAVIDSRQRQMLVQHHSIVALYEAAFGSHAEALRHAEISVRFADELGGDGGYLGQPVSRLIRTNLLCKLERYDEAELELAIAGELAQRMQCGTFLYGQGLAQARIAFARDRTEEGLEALRRTLVLARERKFVHQFWWYEPEASTALFARALAAGIEPAYVQHLIRAQGAPAPTPETPGAEYWPWPIKVHVLGKLKIEKDGEPLDLSESGAQKPLSMLKAIIALNGRQVAEEQLSDKLWPDSEGDRARHSFKVTLHRLRKLLGNEEAIIVRNGTVSLNPQMVWVDALGLDEALEHLGASYAKPAVVLGEAARRAASLYRGPLFEHEAALWAVHSRERMRDRYLRLITRAADALAQSEIKTAVDIYEKVLQVDPLREATYQKLMRGYQAMGHKADAVDTYLRCRDILRLELKLLPSEDTEALYRTLN